MVSGPAAAVAAAEPAGPQRHGQPRSQRPRLFRINRAIRAGNHEGLKKLLAQGPLPKVGWDLLNASAAQLERSPAGTDPARLRQSCRLLAVPNVPFPAQVPLLGEDDDFICFSYDGSEGSDFYGTRDEQDPFYTLLLEGGSQDSRVRHAADVACNAIQLGYLQASQWLHCAALLWDMRPQRFACRPVLMPLRCRCSELCRADLPISTPILLPPHDRRWPCARRCWLQAAAQPCTQKWVLRHAPQATASSWTGACGCIGCHNGRLQAALPVLHAVLACCAAFVSMMAAAGMLPLSPNRLELRNFNILFDWERPDVAAKLAKFERGVPAPVAAVQLDGPNRCGLHAAR